MRDRKLSLLLMTGLTVATDGGCGSNSENDPGLQFLNVRVEEIGARRAVVRFDTSRPTTCEVEYGTSKTNLNATATDPTMDEGEFATEHNVPLEDLRSQSTYHFRTRATDNAGRTYFSEVSRFSTTATSGVEPSSMINIATRAQGASIRMVSSNFGGGGNDSFWGADKAIDGLMGTEWSSHGDGDNAFVTIDLGQMRTIQALSFRSRKMTDGSSIIRSIRLIFDDNPSTATEVYPTPDPDQVYTFSFNAPISARTVTVEAVETTGGNTGVKEIQLLSDSR